MKNMIKIAGRKNQNEGNKGASRLSPAAVSLLADFALLLCALFWGVSFATMKVLVAVYPPCWLLFLRFSAGALLILLFFHGRIARAWKKALTGGVIIGAALFAAIVTQTVALKFMPAGRGAFISATYVLMVPLLLWGLRRVFPGWVTLFAACLCLAGMGLLTSDISGPAGFGDVLTLLCALFFAVQIIAIGHYAGGEDPVVLSFVEFVTLALLSFAGAVLFERSPESPLTVYAEGLGELAFTIVFCTFVSYVVQICAQKYARSSHAALIMSLESVFGLLSGIIFLGESLSLRTAAGCALIFLSVLLVELEPFCHKNPDKN